LHHQIDGAKDGEGGEHEKEENCHLVVKASLGC
jgi:hypothetical protein